MGESRLTREYGELLEKANCKVVAFVASTMQEPGIPDRWVCGKDIPGLWIEFKKDGGKLRAAQELWLKKAWECCVPCCVMRFSGHTIYVEDPYGNVLGEQLFPDTPRDARHTLASIYVLVSETAQSEEN